VSKHAILLGANGQLTEGTLFGRAEYAACGADRYAVTGHIMRLLVAPEESGWLFAFLSTELGWRIAHDGNRN